MELPKETIVPSMISASELAKAILVPFERIPITIAELRDALNSKLLRKLPVHGEVLWDALRGDEAAKEIFEEDSFPGLRISMVDMACLLCFRKNRYGGVRSARVWDIILSDLWNYLLDSAEYPIPSGAMDCIEDESSTDLLFRVHGKEVVYVEDGCKTTDAAQQARMKLRRLDPLYFSNMKHMVCVYTNMAQFSVSAKSGYSEDDHTLIDEQALDSPSGLCTAFKTSINLLRYALSWAPELEKTPRKNDEMLLNDSKEYEPFPSITRTIEELHLA